jgi:hypothetical protein
MKLQRMLALAAAGTSRKTKMKVLSWVVNPAVSWAKHFNPA